MTAKLFQARLDVQFLSAITFCRVTRTTAQSIPDNTLTPIQFTTDLNDEDNLHDTVTNPERIQIPITGVYVMLFTGNFAANAVGAARRAVIQLMPGASNPANLIRVPHPSSTTHVFCTALFVATAGEYVQALVLQDSGGALDINPATFALARIGAAT